jgi:predicted PurR-regulated permease PerM
MEEKPSRYLPFRVLVWGLLIGLVLALLLMAKTLLQPLFLAILLAFLLHPVSEFLRRRLRIPHGVAIFMCVVGSVAVLVVSSVVLTQQLSNFISETPKLKERVSDNIEHIQEGLSHVLGVPISEQQQFINKQLNNAIGQSGEALQTLASATLSTAVTIGILPVYTFFLLLYRLKFYGLLCDIIRSTHYKRADLIVSQVSRVTGRYMSGIITVVLILCVLNSTGLWLVGAKYAILLGVVSAVANFIPYFGTLIGGGLALVISLMLQGDLHVALGIAILFIVIQFLENNILTPRITGGSVRLNPLITILAIVTGGMVWGVIGMFVSVPFLGMFRIVCANIEPLQPLGRFLTAGKR